MKLSRSVLLNDQIKSFVSTSLAHFVNDGGTFFFPVIYPLLISSYSISYLEVAVLATLVNVAQVLAGPIIGRRADSSRKYASLITLGLILLGSGVAGYVFSMLYFKSGTLLGFLLLWTTISGVGLAFFHPISATLLKEKFDAQSIGRVLGIGGSLGSAGRTFLPLAAVVLIAAYSISSVFILSGVTIVAAFVVLFIMRDVKFPLRGEKVNGPKTRRSKIPLRMLPRGVFVLVAISIARGVYSGGTLQFIPVYLNTVVHIQYGYLLGFFVTLMLATAIVGQPLFGFLADRFGRKLIMAVANGGGVASMLLFLLYRNQSYSIVFLAAFGLFTLNAYPLLFGLATEVAPKGAETVTGSLVWNVGNVGGFSVGPLLVGLLSERYLLGSLTNGFYVVTLIGVFSVLLLPFVRRPRYDRSSVQESSSVNPSSGHAAEGAVK